MEKNNMDYAGTGIGGTVKITDETIEFLESEYVI
jgi:hypothetical protein